MEEDGCCYCGGRAGLQRRNTFQPLRQQERPPRRMARCLAVALLLMVSLAVAVLVVVTVVQGGRGQQSPDTQPLMQPHSLSSGDGIEQQQQKDFKNPSVMLTAPRGNNTVGEYLAWESVLGNAFCNGGFIYSSGDLVVPRPGIYRVFLQITYENKHHFNCHGDELRLSNSVYVFQDTYQDDVRLLSSMETVSCSMEQWSKSLYTAGLFYLEANSKLRVTALYPQLIANTKESQVFFGAELLPQ
ncbi:tumor necrosis factor-like [Plectropomus leopardus]|uniref:tumor necrosis factor-like n=1 Tax=Plectropomus leopardus TaxID=160734 RepID=UPI001C4CDC42|nr:tumor necrosis factor-like [Plectropomus leopardus]